jgi:hypothetical protein
MQLENIAEIKTGYPLRGKAMPQQEGNLMLVQMKDVHPSEGVDWSTPIRIADKSRKQPDFLQHDEILFVGRGSRMFAVYVKEPPFASVASPHFYVISPHRQAHVLPQYLVWYLNSLDAQRYYAQNTEGSALPYISRKALSQIPVPLPPMEMQEHIINTDRCWKKERRLLEELIEKREILITNILAKSITQGEAA